MLQKTTHRRRGVRRTLLAAVLALPLLAASQCDDLLGTGANYDGTYVLESVNGQGMPYTMQSYGNNRLVLERGEWTVSGSGTRLDTKMWSYMVLNGVRQAPDPRFSPERHTGTITLSGNTATGTLDTGSTVRTTFETGTMLTSYNGHQMYFRKR